MEARLSPRDFFISAINRGDVASAQTAIKDLGVSPSIIIMSAAGIMTPAHIAVLKKNSKLLALLIECDADLTKKNHLKQTVIEYAITCESWDCYELLVQKQELDKAKLSAPKPLTVKQLIINAASTNNLLELDRLLTGSVSPDFYIGKEPALHFAIRTINIELLQLLIRKNAKIYIKVNGQTALDLAISNGDKAAVEAFLCRAIPQPAEYECFRNGLSKALQSNQLEIAKILVNYLKNIFPQLKTVDVSKPETFQHFKAKFGELPDEISEFFLDPIVPDEFTEPMIVPHGETYNRSTTSYFTGDPYTRQPLGTEDFIPNKIIMALIKHYKSWADINQIPPCLIFPHTKKLFKVPVVAVDGETYEEEWLKTQLRTYNNKLPNGQLQNKMPYPNKLVEAIIQRMKYGAELAPVAPAPKIEMPPKVASPILKGVEVVQPVQVLPSVPKREVLPPAKVGPLSLDQITELLEDLVSLDLFDEPIIYSDGKTFNKSTVIGPNNPKGKHPTNSSEDFRMEEALPNYLVATLVAYFSSPDVDLTKIPPCLICPETGKLYEFPVVAVDGKTYEKDDLERYLIRNKNKLPGSGLKQDRFLYQYENLVVKDVIALFKKALAPVAVSDQKAEEAEVRLSDQGLFGSRQILSTLAPAPAPSNLEQSPAQPKF